MLSIRLPEPLAQRLQLLADETGRSKSFYVREAISVYMEQLEHAYRPHRAKAWQPSAETLEAIKEAESGQLEALTVAECKAEIRAILNEKS